MGRELVKRTLIIGVALVALGSTVSVLISYVQEKRYISRLLDSVEVSDSGAIAEALWIGNTQMLRVQLAGIVRDEYVSYAEVVEPGDLHVSSGVQGSRGREQHRFALMYTYDDQRRRIGSLIVEVDYSLLHLRALGSGLVGSLYPILTILVVGIFFYLALHRSIVGPVTHIARYLSEFDSESEPYALTLMRPERSDDRRDEIDDVVDAINTLRERLNLRHKHLEEARHSVQLQVEEKTRALAMTNRTLTRQLDDLRRTRNELEEAEQARSLFLANMSHEIRTPISGIVGIARMLSELELTSEQQEHVQMIAESADSLTEIIDDLLEYGRLGAHQIALVNETFSPEETTRSVISLLEPTRQRQGCTLTLQIDPDLPERVQGDAVRLQQVLRNLLSNALKFAPGGDVRIELRSMTVPGITRSSVIRFSVSDNGKGIAKEAMPRLFQSFYQEDSSYAKEHGGSGLGLAICRRLVDLMGGEIWAESTLGKGSIFSFQIPFVLPDDARSDTPGEHDTAAADTEASSDASVTLPSLRILLAEDNRINQIYIERILSNAGHDVTVANNGEEVLDLFDPDYHDLILMDIQMPGVDGLEATRQIRKVSSVPIIALTAYARRSELNSFLAEGMNETVTKPVNETVLHDAIYRCVRPGAR